jgi:NAD(P) transhydrogenase subunit beta
VSGFDSTVALVYLAAAVTFVLGLHLMNSPASARKGNRLSAAGMTVAIVLTVVVLVHADVINGTAAGILAAGLVVGGLAGLVTARRV